MNDLNVPTGDINGSEIGDVFGVASNGLLVGRGWALALSADELQCGWNMFAGHYNAARAVAWFLTGEPYVLALADRS